MEVLGNDLLMCTICYEQVKNPKVLPCLHSFCQICIEKHFHITRLKNEGRLTCPACREVIPLPMRGVAGFKNDLVSVKIRDLLKKFPNMDDIHDPGDHDLELDGKMDALNDIRKDLQDRVIDFDKVLAKLRHNVLMLYSIENRVKDSIDAEVISKIKETAKRAKECKLEKIPDDQIRSMVEERHAPIIAQLVSEQDVFYSKIIDIKSLHDLTQEALDKLDSLQLHKAYPFLRRAIENTLPIVKRMDVQMHSDSVLKLPPELMNLAKELNTNGACGISVVKPIRDSRKASVKCIYKISGRGILPGRLDYPTHATFMPNGDIVVCDKNNERLQIFDRKGQFKNELFHGLVKPRRARFNTKDGYIYVSDENAETVKVFTPDGELVRRIGEGFFQCPAGMDFDSKGNIVMTDAEKGYVTVHDQDGEIRAKFFFRYRDDLLVPMPYYVAVNEDDQLIISDSRNNRVKVFSSSGQRLFTINGLDSPRGVCVDPQGNILIAEGDKHRIAMYNPYGKFVQYLIASGDFGLKFPLSIDMNSDGQLVVTQCGYYSPHEVMVFQVC